MFINKANRPMMRLLIQLNLSKYFETRTNDRKINSNANNNPPIHAPRTNSETMPTMLIINTDVRKAVFEKSNKFLFLIRL